VNDTRPDARSITDASGASVSCGSMSKNSKMRSIAAVELLIVTLSSLNRCNGKYRLPRYA
jgi:hypothetical protein